MPETARQVVEGMFKIIGVMGRGRNLSAEDANDGFRRLNNLLAVWSNEGLVIPVLTKVTGLTLTAAQQEYTVGTGLQLSMVEPIAVDHIIITVGTTEFILDPVGSFTEYIRDRNLATERPFKYHYERGVLRFIPTPNDSYATEFWTRVPVGPIANLSTTLGFSDEYAPAIMYNLAVMSAPWHGKEVKQDVRTLAADYKMGIEMRRFKNEPIVSEISGGARKTIEEV